PCPGDADRISLSSLHAIVADGPGLDAGGVEGLRVDQPACGLGEGETHRLLAGPGGEEAIVAWQVEDEGCGVFDVPRGRAQIGDLEERTLRVEEVEAVGELVEVVVDVGDGQAVSPPCRPVIVPDVVLLVVRRPVEDRQQKTSQGERLGRELSVDLADLRRVAESGADRDLRGPTVEVPDGDPWLLQKVERGHSGSSLSDGEDRVKVRPSFGL
ncbi:hypothetical protein ABE10_00565, partial [Bacillus toyonensis]|nr:hypothetical protein [Bacillus toyonensis]